MSEDNKPEVRFVGSSSDQNGLHINLELHLPVQATCTTDRNEAFDQSLVGACKGLWQELPNMFEVEDRIVGLSCTTPFEGLDQDNNACQRQQTITVRLHIGKVFRTDQPGKFNDEDSFVNAVQAVARRNFPEGVPTRAFQLDTACDIPTMSNNGYLYQIHNLSVRKSEE